MNNNRNYLLTGAAGSLGTKICKVRALVLRGDRSAQGLEKQAKKTDGQVSEGGFDVKEAYRSVEDGVVGTYRKIEDSVVDGYKKVEKGAVSGFRKVSDFFIRKFFSRKGETVEETRKRLRRE